MRAISVLLALAAGVGLAQWEPDRRLTFNDSSSRTSYNKAWCVAADGDVVHVVWHDYRDGPPLRSEIYYKRSTDGGATWGPDVRLTDDEAASFYPCIAVSGSIVHVAWWCSDDSIGFYTVRYLHSTDAGSTWSTFQRLGGSGESYGPTPSVAAAGPDVHVVWSMRSPGNWDVFHRCSHDGGFTWEPEACLTSDTAQDDGACVAATGSDVHVAWMRMWGQMDEFEIYYRHSADRGTNWGSEARLSELGDWSVAPCIGVSGPTVHAVWQDYRSPLGIFYAYSTDRGLSWQAPVAICQYPTVTMPSIAVSGSTLHVVWFAGPLAQDVNIEIYYKASSNGGRNWGPDARLTNDTAWSWNPSVAAAGSRVHVVWEDERDGKEEIYYKRNPTGNTPGVEEQTVTPAARLRSPATVVRGTLRLPAADAGDEKSPVLLDAAGRRVISLCPGPNDLSRLAPGVYFCRLRAGGRERTVKLVLER